MCFLRLALSELLLLIRCMVSYIFQLKELTNAAQFLTTDGRTEKEAVELDKEGAENEKEKTASVGYSVGPLLQQQGTINT